MHELFETDDTAIEEEILDPEDENPSKNLNVTLDESLILRLKQRDPKALADLHSCIGATLWNVIARMLINKCDCDDVLNDVLLEIWDKIDRYNPNQGKFLGWAITITHRRTIDLQRKKGSYVRMRERFTESELMPERLHNGHFVFESDCVKDAESLPESFARIKELIYSIYISEEQRECLILHWLESMSQREISEYLQVPLGTIKTRLELGLIKLTELAENDPICATYGEGL